MPSPSPRTAHVFSTNTPAAGIPSDTFIFAAGCAVGVFICIVSAVANAFLLSTGVPYAGTLMKCDAAGGIAAILLVWQLLRWSRERNQLVRERARIIAELNHEVRNAIQAISLTDYQKNGLDSSQIEFSVCRIERALDEYVPQLPADRATRMRHDRSA
jgi:hypothetical protein